MGAKSVLDIMGEQMPDSENPNKQTIIGFAQDGKVFRERLPTGDAEEKYCEIYETMPAILPPYSFELGKMFMDSVAEAVRLYGPSVCHGVLICGTDKMLVYGNEAFLGVVYGCVACTGLKLESE